MRFPWSGSDRRCGNWKLGPFYTDWRCLLPHDHEKVEGHGHIYEPDLWPGGRLHNEWVGRGGLSAGAHWSVKDTSKARAICEECGPLGMWAQDEIEAKYAEHAWEHAPSVRYEWENE